MASQYTLHAPAGSFRAFPVLIAAEYNGIDIHVPEFDSSAIAKLSPVGKAPVLISGKTTIFGSHAMARFVANIRRDTNLLGSSIQEEAQVDGWMEFCALQVELPASVLVYPVMGYMAFHPQAYIKAKVDLAKSLSILETRLSQNKYLVGDGLTLADVVVCSALVYPFKFVMDKAYLQPFPKVLQWFQHCTSESQFQAVVGNVVLCKKELKAKGQKEEAKTKEKKKHVHKEKKRVHKEKEKQAPPKKTEHPYKIMDREFPSSFSLDSWKKIYSNTTSYDQAMAQFWNDYDAQGWSLWLQTYNHNSDNTKIFMTSNAIGGFQQRTDAIRRWAFGVMDVLGTEETLLEISGVWLLRGDSVEQMMQANDDANWYTWTKLAGKDMPPTDEVKAQVAAYWCSETELDGKPIQDSKVFK